MELCSGACFEETYHCHSCRLQVFTPLPDVQSAAFAPSIVAAALQVVSGVTFMSEGLMQGHQAFTRLALNTCLATVGLLISLQFLGQDLMGVWLSFWVFNLLRMAGGIFHHFFVGPLARRNLPPLQPAAA